MSREFSLCPHCSADIKPIGDPGVCWQCKKTLPGHEAAAGAPIVKVPPSSFPVWRPLFFWLFMVFVALLTAALALSTVFGLIIAIPMWLVMMPSLISTRFLVPWLKERGVADSLLAWLPRLQFAGMMAAFLFLPSCSDHIMSPQENARASRNLAIACCGGAVWLAATAAFVVLYAKNRRPRDILLRAGLFLAFLSFAQAQTTRSRILNALAPAPVEETLINIINAFDAAGRQKALGALDELDRGLLSSSEWDELGEAYRLLGRSDLAVAAARDYAQSNPGTAADIQFIRALEKSGNYSEAQAAAEAALKQSPSDKNLLAAYHQVRNRGAGEKRPPAIAPSMRDGIVAQPGDSRPYVLPVSRPKRVSTQAGVESLSLSGGDDAEPPTFWDRITAFILPDDEIIAEDIAMLRAKARDFDIPENTLSMATTKPEVPKEFVAWLKTMKPEDLPPISYGIIDPGDFAVYKKGLGKGKIVMSHFIRDAEPEVRATAMMHEVFHFWDIHVAGNPYSTESYGYTAAENMPDREYDPYHLTALFWRHARPAAVSSLAAKNLDRFPVEQEEMRRKVDALYERKRSKER